MIIKGNPPRLPQANPHCLGAIAPSKLAAAYVAAQKEGCSRADAAAALADFFDAGAVLEEALKAALIEERDGLLYAVAQAGINGTGRRPASWGEAKRDFACSALGIEPGAKGQAARDLAGGALRQLFGLDNLPPAPSRAEARCELLRRIVASYGEPFATQVSLPAKAFPFDPMSRGIYLSFAGLGTGTVLQADAALLSSAFGGPAAAIGELSATIIQAALRADRAAAQETAKEGSAFDLDGFAESIKKLAGKLETKPYAGRVAIAQVYDSGLAQGLDLGTLDEFKQNLAEAAREGLLDLERYDITGPLDAGLQERSRLRLGRDERHFIVNQWI